MIRMRKNEKNELKKEKLTIEDIKAIDVAINKKKILPVLDKVIKKLKTKIEQKKFVSEFGTNIKLKIKRKSITLLIDDKKIAKFNNKETNNVIANGFQDTDSVKVTSIIKKETYQNNKKIKFSTKRAILIGLVISVFPTINFINNYKKKLAK